MKSSYICVVKKNFFFCFIILFLFAAQAQTKLKYFYNNKIEVKGNNGAVLKDAWIGGLNSPQFHPFDLNNDGKNDLLVYERATNSLLPFLRINNAYTFAPQFIKYFPQIQGSFYTADINSDNKLDFFTINTQSSPIYYLNKTKSIDTFPLLDTVVEFYFRNKYDSNFFILFNQFTLSKSDIHSIKDIDNDGDLDIVTYDNNTGSYTCYKDVRSDYAWKKDTFQFQVMQYCFGDFIETGFSSLVLKKCSNAEKFLPRRRHTTGASCVFWDQNNDGDYEMLISNSGAKYFNYLYNAKKDKNRFWDTMYQYDSIFPKTGYRAGNFMFPAGYYVDVDFDGVNDLICAPNMAVNGKETNNVEFFKNTGQNANPSFSFQKTNFIVEGVLDHGAKAAPAFFDFDADGDLDMFVAANGDFEITAGNKDRIFVYKNIGNKNNPSFELINSDYLNISAKGISDLNIHFGDVNGDGQLDLLCGSRLGFVYYFKNTAAAGSPANFSFVTDDLLQVNIGIKETNSAVCLYDYNADGKKDILLGNYSGKIYLYKNTSTSATNVSFELVTKNAWGMRGDKFEVDANPPQFLRIGEAYPQVADLDNDGKEEVIVGGNAGAIRVYHPAGKNITDSLIADTNYQFAYGRGKWEKSTMPLFAFPAIANLYNDKFPEIVVGTNGGGVQLFVLDPSVKTKPISEPLSKLKIYPNPAASYLYIERNAQLNMDLTIELISAEGKLVRSSNLQKGENKIGLGLANVVPGFYIVKVSNGNSSYSEKIIVK